MLVMLSCYVIIMLMLKVCSWCVFYFLSLNLFPLTWCIHTWFEKTFLNILTLCRWRHMDQWRRRRRRSSFWSRWGCALRSRTTFEHRSLAKRSALNSSRKRALRLSFSSVLVFYFVWFLVIQFIIFVGGVFSYSIFITVWFSLMFRIWNWNIIIWWFKLISTRAPTCPYVNITEPYMTLPVFWKMPPNGSRYLYICILIIVLLILFSFAVYFSNTKNIVTSFAI